MRRISLSWLILFFFFSLSLFLALSTGPVKLSLFALSPRDRTILLNLRLPRALSSFFVGGGLALSGAVFQGLFRNPLADSYLLGISSGASLGAAAALVLGFTSPLAMFTGVSFFSFLGSLLALWCFILAAAMATSQSSVCSSQVWGWGCFFPPWWLFS